MLYQEHYMPIVHLNTAHTHKPNVDIENRIISGVIMAQVGEAAGHGVHIELAELQKATQQARRMGKVPCEFGHNHEGLGKSLGNFLNFRMEGNQMKADLQFSSSADNSPSYPGMASYILQLAREDNNQVNASIKFERGNYYQRDGSGTKIRVYYYSKENGWIRPIKEYGNVFLEIKQLRGCDLVSNGALTTKLFSNEHMYTRLQEIINSAEFLPMLEQHYHEMPQLADFFHQKGEKGVIQKLKSFFNNNNKEQQPMNTDSQKPNPETKSTIQEQLSEALDRITQLEAQRNAETPQGQLKAAQDRIAELEAQNGPSVEEQLAEANAKIKELETTPATETTSTSTSTEDLGEKPAYLNMSIHQEAIDLGIGKRKRKPAEAK